MPNIRSEVIIRERDFRFFDGRRHVTIRAGIFLDLDRLPELVLKAAKNKGKCARHGALVAEFHQFVEGKL